MSTFQKQLRCFVCAVLGLAVLACASTRPAVVEVQQELPEDVTIVFAGNTLGAVEPQGCGCRRLGGLPRRAQVVRQARAGDPRVLVFDSGNLLGPASEADPDSVRLKARYTLAALRAMGTDAVNVGEFDCAAGVGYLKQLGKTMQVGLVSANLRFAATGSLVFNPHLIKTLGGTRVGVFGLSGMSAPAGVLKDQGVYFDDPLESARQAVAQLQQSGCRPVVLLSLLPREQNEMIAREVSGIDFILGSSSQDGTRVSEAAGSSFLIDPGMGGSYAACIEMHLEDQEALFADERVRELLQNRIGNLRKREASLDDTVRREGLARQRLSLEQQLADLNARNLFTAVFTALDSSVSGDSDVQLVVERYKEELARQRIAGYSSSVPEVDVTELPEARQRMALRLMNQLECEGRQSIAQGSASSLFCRDLARIVVDSITDGDGEGMVRYRVLYAKEKQENSLDKKLGLQ